MSNKKKELIKCVALVQVAYDGELYSKGSVIHIDEQDA